MGAGATKVEYVSLVPISNGMTIIDQGQVRRDEQRHDRDRPGLPERLADHRHRGDQGPAAPGLRAREPELDPLPPQRRARGPDASGTLDVVSFTVILADGNDSFRPGDGGIPEDVELYVEAGDGNDTVIGHPGGGTETLLGGAGDDILITGEPADRKELDGGTGDDKIFVGAGQDPGQVMAAKGGRAPRARRSAGRPATTS